MFAPEAFSSLVAVAASSVHTWIAFTSADRKLTVSPLEMPAERLSNNALPKHQVSLTEAVASLQKIILQCISKRAQTVSTVCLQWMSIGNGFIWGKCSFLVLMFYRNVLLFEMFGDVWSEESKIILEAGLFFWICSFSWGSGLLAACGQN